MVPPLFAGAAIFAEPPGAFNLNGDTAAIARDSGRRAITVCDGAFATPVLQHPLDCGIDMAVHSTTKYIGGHSDVVGGVLIARFNNYIFERARKSQRYGGAVPSPFDCWLSLRGIETLPCRVRVHSENALARFLDRHMKVKAVHYPGLPGHPGQATPLRQMCGGFGGMLSFQVLGGVKKRWQPRRDASYLSARRAWAIEHRESFEGPDKKTPRNLLRVSVGLEHIDDLIGDLADALG